MSGKRPASDFPIVEDLEVSDYLPLLRLGEANPELRNKRITPGNAFASLFQAPELLQDVVEQLVSKQIFIDNLVDVIISNQALLENLTENSTFQTLVGNFWDDEDRTEAFAVALAVHQDFITNMISVMVTNEDIRNEIINTFVNNETFLTQVGNFWDDPDRAQLFATFITENAEIVQQIALELVTNSTVVEQLILQQDFMTSIVNSTVNKIVEDEISLQNFIDVLVNNEIFLTEMSSNETFVGEMLQVFSDSIGQGAKAWAVFDLTQASPVLLGNFNIAAIEKLATGSVKLTFNEPLLSAIYAVTLGQRNNAGAAFGRAHVGQGDMSVSLLLPMDGENGSTDFPDLSNHKHAVTAVGDAQISTAQSKFGGASALFDGSGDYLSVPNHAGFSFEAGDFTVETWVRTASSDTQVMISKGWGGAGPFSWILDISGKKARGRVSTTSGGTSTSVIGTSDIDDGEWHHIAFVRDGNTLMIFVDGVLENTESFSGTVFTNTKNVLLGVRDGAGTVSDYLDGYLDDSRIIKGVAKYIEAFTPPASAHSAPEGPKGVSHLYIESEVGGTLIDLPEISVAVHGA